MPSSTDLTLQPIAVLIRRLAIPASVGFLFNTLFNVVDTYFGGLISTEVLAALSLSLPVFFIIVAMGTGLSTGTTALIANALGSEDRDRARLYAVQGITFGILAAIVTTFIGCHLSPFLFRTLGATGAYLATAMLYIDTIFAGTIFFIIAYMLNAILTATGDTKSFRNFLVTGFFLNIGLDPLFIFGGFGIPPMGIAGIALATVLIQMMGSIYLGFKVHRSGLLKGKTLKDIFPKRRPFRDIAYQGFPASFNMITIGIGFFVITWFISAFGKDAVAAYGIGIRIEQIVLVPTIGLNIATLTLVAQNNGAGLFHRITETLHKALLYGGIISAAGTVVVLAGAPFLMAIFTDDQGVIAIGTTYIRIDALVFYAYIILFVHVAALQGIKKPMYAVWIGLIRQLAAPVVIFYLFVTVFGWGLLGIWWGFFLITWSAALFTIFYSRHLLTRNRLSAGLKFP